MFNDLTPGPSPKERGVAVPLSSPLPNQWKATPLSFGEGPGVRSRVKSKASASHTIFSFTLLICFMASPQPPPKEGEWPFPPYHPCQTKERPLPLLWRGLGGGRFTLIATEKFCPGLKRLVVCSRCTMLPSSPANFGNCL